MPFSGGNSLSDSPKDQGPKVIRKPIGQKIRRPAEEQPVRQQGS